MHQMLVEFIRQPVMFPSVLWAVSLQSIRRLIRTYDFIENYELKPDVHKKAKKFSTANIPLSLATKIFNVQKAVTSEFLW